MKLHTINTGLFKLDGGAMFGVVPKSMWHKLNPPDDFNMCTWAMRCLLIEDGKRLILIDTGIGNKQDDKFRSHFMPHGNDTLYKALQYFDSYYTFAASFKKINNMSGSKITVNNGVLNVPNNPVIPFIEGDGIGADIWAASVRVFDAAVEKAYGGTKKVEWKEIDGKDKITLKDK